MTSVGISHRTHGERKMKRKSVMECFISPFTRLMILFPHLVEAEAADGERDEKVALPAFGFYWICRKNWTIRLMNCWSMQRCEGCWTRNSNAVELIKEARLLLIRNISKRCYANESNPGTSNEIWFVFAFHSLERRHQKALWRNLFHLL